MDNYYLIDGSCSDSTVDATGINKKNDNQLALQLSKC